MVFYCKKIVKVLYYNVVISDVLEEKLLESKKKLEELEGNGEVLECLCDVTKEEDLQKLDGCSSG